MKPLDISHNKLAREIKVSPRRVNEIVLEKRAVTPETALRLSRYFVSSERFWLGLQLDFDLEEARRKLAADIDREIQPMARPPESSTERPTADSARSGLIVNPILNQPSTRPARDATLRSGPAVAASTRGMTADAVETRDPSRGRSPPCWR